MSQPFKCVYQSPHGSVFYIHESEGNYCAFAFDTWLTGDTVEAVIQEIDKYCQELIALYNSHQG